MKKLFKTIVALSATSAMLLSTTALAATTSTVTKYTSTGATVTSTVNGLTGGSMITYLAVAGTDATAVGENGENIKYISQQTLGETQTSTTFSYSLTNVDEVAGTYATVKYGSNKDTFEPATNAIGGGNVTVTWTGATAGTVDNNAADANGVYTVAVGIGDTDTLNLAAAAATEIVKVTVNGKAVDATSGTITVVPNDAVVVTVIPTDSTAMVYQLMDAEVAQDTDYNYAENGNEKVNRNSGVVRVVGTVKKVYFTFNHATNGSYQMDGTKEQFEVSLTDETTGGYYGVEIEDKNVDVSQYDPTAWYIVDTDAVEAEKIQ